MSSRHYAVICHSEEDQPTPYQKGLLRTLVNEKTISGSRTIWHGDRHTLLLARVLCTLVLLIAHMAVAAGAIVRASSAGAQLDADLTKGGGNDDTNILQSVLDRAADGTPVHLVVDGVALVSGLNVYGRTTVECIEGGGLYLKDGSSRAIIRNVHRSKGGITDEHITIRGCFLNGNRDHQSSADIPRADLPWCCTPSHKEADGTFITGLQFFGVNDLTIENVTLSNILAFGAMIANANRVAIKNVTADTGLPDNVDKAQHHLHTTDGLYLRGPLQYITVDGVKLRTGDAGLALSADTWEGNLYGPYVGTGPITDVSITNVQFMGARGIDLWSAKERIDRVIISNLTGTVGDGWVVGLSDWVNPNGPGNFGSIMIDDVTVDRPKINAAKVAQLQARLEERERQGGQAEAWAKVLREFNSYFAITGQVEHLTVRNIVTKVTDDRPILALGSDTRVELLTADLTLLDPTLQAVPLKLDEGSRIERLDFALRWHGTGRDRGKNPIVSRGGTVEQVNWVNTPPMYADAELISSNAVVVTFTQAVKAMDFKAGVDIKMNGKPVGIARVVHEPGRTDAARYVLKESAHSGATMTWTYNAAIGNIENLSGDQLLSVSDRAISRASESP